jgi:uncharacterized protein (DUF488 family)
LILYTVGYSDFFEKKELIYRLKELNIKHLVDIRTFPFSKTFPQYDEPSFKKELEKEGINHTFLGENIGGLIFKNHFKEGVVSIFDLLKDKKIKDGLNALYKIAKKEKTIIMCAEKEPFNCHRIAISFLFREKVKAKVINIFSNREETFEETLKRFKTENKLSSLSISDENRGLNFYTDTKTKGKKDFPIKIKI